MALKKHLINTHGVPGEYHKIHSIEKKGKQLIVELDAYTNESYRNLEAISNYVQEEQKLVAEREKLKETLDAWTEDDYKRYDEIQDAISLIYSTMENADASYVLYRTSVVIDIDDIDDISFTEIYEKIKQTDKFRGAKDC